MYLAVRWGHVHCASAETRTLSQDDSIIPLLVIISSMAIDRSRAVAIVVAVVVNVVVDVVVQLPTAYGRQYFVLSLLSTAFLEVAIAWRTSSHWLVGRSCRPPHRSASHWSLVRHAVDNRRRVDILILILHTGVFPAGRTRAKLLKCYGGRGTCKGVCGEGGSMNRWLIHSQNYSRCS